MDDAANPELDDFLAKIEVELAVRGWAGTCAFTDGRRMVAGTWMPGKTRPEAMIACYTQSIRQAVDKMDQMAGISQIILSSEESMEPRKPSDD